MTTGVCIYVISNSISFFVAYYICCVGEILVGSLPDVCIGSLMKIQLHINIIIIIIFVLK